jgi:hypothetical protein
MSPDACIAALDDALMQAAETVILRRKAGASHVDVTCPARVDAISVQEIAAGINQTDLHVIISPTPLNNAQWTGALPTPLAAPFDVDPRIPLIGSDKVIVENRLRTVIFVALQSVENTLVRINMRVTG